MTNTFPSLGVIMLALIAYEAGAQTPTNVMQMKLPTGTPQAPQGIKALEVKPGAVPFGTNEVGMYVRSHRLPKSVGELSLLQVESLEFITAREVHSRLEGASTGLPSNHRVAFAIVRGPLYFTGPPPGTPVRFERGYYLFDAKTGNLLMSGTLSKGKVSAEKGK